MLLLEDIETRKKRLTHSALVEIFDKFFILAKKLNCSKLFIALFFFKNMTKITEKYA
jgi:hypothetical protein